MDGKKLEYKGLEALNELERLTMKAGEVQEEILRSILAQNWDTEYLKKYLGSGDNNSTFSSAKSVSLFKNRVPVITYKYIRPYIVRIANGEDSSLVTGHPITEMLCSSGTSEGEPKLMPSIAEDLDRRTFLYNLLMPIINQYIPGLDQGKAMYLSFVKSETSTPCGLPARTVLTSYYKSPHYKLRHRDDPFNDYTSPDAAVLCRDSEQSMYCQLLSGLVHRHRVLRLGAVFASAFLRAISFLQRNWHLLCQDIRAGSLNHDVVTDAQCRLAMSDILKAPDPDSADEIERICTETTSWKGIVCSLWPNAKYLEAVVTGSMSQYVTPLRYYCGENNRIPLVCPMYASSECYFGVNTNPLCDPSDVSFTLLPNMGYFEFIPLGENIDSLCMDYDQDDEDDDGDREQSERKVCRATQLVDLVHVEVGCFYELVVTTFAGLNRYRIGDVLQVTGHHNAAPQFRFICRRNVVLSIDNDKTNEQDLHRSVTRAAKTLLEPLDALLVEYTSYADTSTVPGHYVLYWEIKLNPTTTTTTITAAQNGRVSDEVMAECCIAVEEGLDYVYRRCRSNDRSVGPLEIRVVKGGTFEKLMDLFIDQGGASINQYKTPRCVKSKAALKLLRSNVSDCYFSPRDPVWSPSLT